MKKAGTVQADGSMKVEPTFDVEHVVSTVVYMSNLPLDTNAEFVTIVATDIPTSAVVSRSHPYSPTKQRHRGRRI